MLELHAPVDDLTHSELKPPMKHDSWWRHKARVQERAQQLQFILVLALQLAAHLSGAQQDGMSRVKRTYSEAEHLSVANRMPVDVRAKRCDKYNNSTTAKLGSGLSQLNKRICFALNAGRRSWDRRSATNLDSVQ